MPSNSTAGDRRKQYPAVDATDQRVDEVLGMRHQAEHVEALVVDARDVVDGAVRIVAAADAARGVAITERDASRAFELGKPGGVDNVITLAVCDGEFDDLAARVSPGERGGVRLHCEMLHLADEAAPRVAHEHPRQQAGLAENLEAVAYPEHQAAPRGMGADRLHHAGPRGDRPAAEGVAVGEAAR